MIVIPHKLPETGSCRGIGRTSHIAVTIWSSKQLLIKGEKPGQHSSHGGKAQQLICMAYIRIPVQEMP